MFTRQRIAGAVAAALMAAGFLLMVRAVLHPGSLKDEAGPGATVAAGAPSAPPGSVEWTTSAAGAAPARQRLPIELRMNDAGDPAPQRVQEPPAAEPEERPQEDSGGNGRAVGARVQEGERPVQPASTVRVRRAAAPASMRVGEAAVCTSVKDREPKRAGVSFPASVGKLYCWVRVIHGERRKVRMVWHIAGEDHSGEWLEVGSPAWRTWSYKSLPRGFTGSASVDVVDDAGAVLKTLDFKVTAR